MKYILTIAILSVALCACGSGSAPKKNTTTQTIDSVSTNTADGAIKDSISKVQVVIEPLKIELYQDSVSM